MPFKIVRNDITKMNTQAIVNTANSYPEVGDGCDTAIYRAAGYEELLKYRQEYIGYVQEGNAFITPSFNLAAEYIIHAVSPIYINGERGEEEKLRSCYKKSLALAKENGIQSIAFPLIATGSFGYPKEEGMRIAVDEINAFLFQHEMDIYLVVFDTKSSMLGEKIFPDLEAYIDSNYVRDAREKEYGDRYFGSVRKDTPGYDVYYQAAAELDERLLKNARKSKSDKASKMSAPQMPLPVMVQKHEECEEASFLWKEDSIEELSGKLNERLAHRSDTFSEYLLYLIESKGMKNVDVYKRAIVDKRYFAKLKNNKDFHPEKLKALCLCVGAQLNLDETKDLLARAGYALSPADMTDIIFAFFIEHEHFDVIDIDIQLEEHGLPCIIS